MDRTGGRDHSSLDFLRGSTKKGMGCKPERETAPQATILGPRSPLPASGWWQVNVCGRSRPGCVGRDSGVRKPGVAHALTWTAPTEPLGHGRPGSLLTDILQKQDGVGTGHSGVRADTFHQEAVLVCGKLRDRIKLTLDVRPPLVRCVVRTVPLLFGSAVNRYDEEGPSVPRAQGTPATPEATPTSSPPRKSDTGCRWGPPCPPPRCMSGSPRREPCNPGPRRPPQGSLLGLQRRQPRKTKRIPKPL